jgi:hypothetical protein
MQDALSIIQLLRLSRAETDIALAIGRAPGRTSRADLVARSGVSRTWAAKALRELVRRGIVLRQDTGPTDAPALCLAPWSVLRKIAESDHAGSGEEYTGHATGAAWADRMVWAWRHGSGLPRWREVGRRLALRLGPDGLDEAGLLDYQRAVTP